MTPLVIDLFADAPGNWLATKAVTMTKRFSDDEVLAAKLGMPYGPDGKVPVVPNLDTEHATRMAAPAAPKPKRKPAPRIPVQCNECQKKFSVHPNSSADECPKCGGADIDVR